MKNPQEKFWSSKFGKEYVSRNTFDPKGLDKLYTANFGISRLKLNKEFLDKLKINNVLEVGCNIGNQLKLLQKHGFKNLYGIDIFPEAVEQAKYHTKNINIIEASALNLPFKDNCFDLVFTSGVLIHTHPKDLKKLMGEIYRTSNKYIWGYEYYAPKHTAVDYRNNKNYLWKGDFCQMYLNLFSDLKVIKRSKLKYLNSDNYDEMFLLKKKGVYGIK